MYGDGARAGGVKVNLHTRGQTPMPMPGLRVPRGADPPTVEYVAIGRFWAQIRVSGYHYEYVAYVRLDGSAHHLIIDPRTARARRVLPDLDARGLWVRTCGPLFVPGDPTYDSIDPSTPPNVAYAYQRPLLVFARPSPTPFGEVALLLQRCGSRRRMDIGPIQTGLGLPPQIAGHTIAWLDRGAVRLRRTSPAAARTRTWRVPGDAGRLALTGRLAVVATRDGHVLTRRLPPPAVPAAPSPGP